MKGFLKSEGILTVIGFPYLCITKPPVQISLRKGNNFKVKYVVCMCMLSHFNCVQVFATPWTVVHQAPLSMGFSGQEYGTAYYFLLQGIFLTQGLKVCLLHCRWIFYHRAFRKAQFYCSILFILDTS